MRALVLLCLVALVAADNLALKGSDQCKGVCQDVEKKGCNGGSYVRRLCPGGKNIQCCVPTPSPAASPANNGVGAPCNGGVVGVCQLTSTSCAGEFVPNKCPGSGNVQCCKPKAEPSVPSTPTTPTPTPTPTRPPSNAVSVWPSFHDLWKWYPHGDAAEVKAHIGGGINADYITNTCTIRVTRAMSKAGLDLDGSFKLSNGKNILLVRGADKKGLAIRVAEFNQYVRAKFGPPQVKVQFATDGVDSIPSEFLGKKGMIMFDVRVWDDATGHFDLWDGAKCAHECYFNKARGVFLWTIA